MNRLKLIIILIFYVLNVAAQDSQDDFIRGKTISSSGESLSAIIKVIDNNQNVLMISRANYDGDFEIKLPVSATDTFQILISHIGYSELAFPLKNHTNLQLGTLVLEEEYVNLNEALVQEDPFKSGPLESSQSVITLDRKFFERQGAMTFSQALENVPGMSVIQTGMGISKPVIRGLSFNRIMVMDRGIKQEGQQWGADHGLEIDHEDVERVEIIKGPASLLFGPDAMAGVIQIKPGPLPINNSFQASIKSNYQSNNNLVGFSGMVSGQQQGVLYKARLTLTDFQDYRVPAEQFNYAGFVLPVENNRLKNTAGQERHFSLMTGINRKWGISTITLSRFDQLAGIFTGAVGIPTAYSLSHDGSHSNIDFPRQDNVHWKLISNTKFTKGKQFWEVDLGYQLNGRQEESLPHVHGVGPTPEGNLALGLRLKTYTANIRNTIQFHPQLKVTLGAQSQYMQNIHSGFEFLLPNYESMQGGAFVFAEQEINNKLIITGGLRMDAVHHDISEHLQPIYFRLQRTGEYEERNPDINRSFLGASGSTGVAVNFNPLLHLKLNLGTGYRVPTAVELSTNGIHHGYYRHELGDPTLEAERNFQADLNLAYRFKKSLISVSPFAAFYDGFIYLAPTGRFSPLPGASMLWEYRQNNAVFAGGEITIEQEINDNLSFTAGLEYVINHNLDSGLPLPLTPPGSMVIDFQYSLFTGKILQNVSLAPRFRLVSTQNRTDRNERATEGYALFGMGINANIKLRDHHLGIQLIGHNLTNNFYMNHLSRYRLINLPEPGRNITCTISIPFHNFIQ